MATKTNNATKKNATKPADVQLPQGTGLDDVTMLEVAQIEQLANTPIDAMGDPKAPKARLFMAIAVIIRRRTKPKTTMADIEALTLNEVMDEIGFEA